MSESPKRQSVILGLFVAGAVAILFTGILMIGSVGELFASKIVVHVVFVDVGGLKKGDDVWFSGVQVGVVSGINLHEGSTVKVDLRLDAKAATHIHTDSLAKLSNDGLIGSRIVVIEDGSPAAPLLSDGDELGVAETVSTEEIIATLQSSNENLLAITTNFKTVSARLAAGEGTAGRLLTDESLFESMAVTLGTMEEVSRNANGLTASLRSFSGKLNQPGNLASDLATDETTYAALQRAVGNLEQTSQQAQVLMEGLSEGAADPDTPVGALFVDEEAGEDLKSALDDLNTSSALLAKELDALQYSFLLKGPLKKQKKAQEKAAKEAAERDGAIDGK